MQVPKTVQIRDIDDDVYAALLKRAAEERISVPELLRREAVKLARRPSMQAWLERVGHGPVLDSSGQDVNQILDELRGPWPDADR